MCPFYERPAWLRKANGAMPFGTTESWDRRDGTEGTVYACDTPSSGCGRISLAGRMGLPVRWITSSVELRSSDRSMPAVGRKQQWSGERLSRSPAARPRPLAAGAVLMFCQVAASPLACRPLAATASGAILRPALATSGTGKGTSYFPYASRAACIENLLNSLQKTG
jgi:hypothetical protein